MFLSWYVGEATDPYDFATLVEADLTLTARWAEAVVVTFDLGYVGAPAATEVAIAKGTAVQEPANPIRAYHTFLGWYESAAATDPYVFATLVNANLTLTARWEEVITTIAAFRALATDETAIIQGIVTNVGPYNSFSMEDASGAAVALRIPGKNAKTIDFAVGAMIKVIAKKGIFNDLVQAEAVDSVYEIVSTGNALPAAVDLNAASLAAADLEQYMSRLIKLDNMEIVNRTVDQHDNITLTLKRADEATIVLRWDSRVNLGENQAAFQALAIGDFVNIDGATLGWYYNPQISIDNADQCVKVVAAP